VVLSLVAARAPRARGVRSHVLVTPAPPGPGAPAPRPLGRAPRC